MFLFIATIASAALAGGLLALFLRQRTLDTLAITELFSIALACWSVALISPFVTEVGSTAIDGVMAVAALSVFILGVAYEARKQNPAWAAYFGGILFAGAIWAVSFGIYLEYAAGWQGLNLDDLGNEDMGAGVLWVGAFFFAPTAALPGGLLGLFVSIMTRCSRRVTARA